MLINIELLLLSRKEAPAAYFTLVFVFFFHFQSSMQKSWSPPVPPTGEKEKCRHFC